ncbi:MAG TPA: PAS domain-containing protein, partial [Bacteroidales bacterium]|nr:PAS domain-containing protein [Bacteroidales bacterium]
MDQFIETFLERFDAPVFLSDKQEQNVLYANSAVHEKLNLSDEQLADLSLNELLHEKNIIQNKVILEYNNQCYHVDNKELTISDTEYIKSTLEPCPHPSRVDYLEFQKEMAIRLVHRLRSPLNGILGFTELLKDDIVDPKHKK